MSRSGLCDYIDAYLVFKGTITIKNIAAGNDVNKHVIFKKCLPFTSCIMRTNNTRTDDAQYIDVVMSIYSLRNLVIIIQKHLEFYGNIVEMNWL